MDDLISRAAAIDALKRAAYWQDAERRIVELPAVDAAPVVRCKDCEYCKPLYCNPDGAAAGDGSFECGDTEIQYYAPSYHMNTHYCADGKRRDEPCT